MHLVTSQQSLQVCPRITGIPRPVPKVRGRGGDGDSLDQKLWGNSGTGRVYINQGLILIIPENPQNLGTRMGTSLSKVLGTNWGQGQVQFSGTNSGNLWNSPKFHKETYFDVVEHKSINSQFLLMLLVKIEILRQVENYIFSLFT